MTTQIVRASSPMRRLLPFQGFLLYWGTRYRPYAALLAAPWLLSVLISHFLIGALNTSWAPVIVMIVVWGSAAAFAPLVTITKIDATMWRLPIETRTLVGWTISAGASAIALSWIATTLLIWRPFGWNAPIWWPASMLVALYAVTFAINCRPGVITTPVGVAYVLGVLALAGAGPAASAYGLPARYLLGGYFAVSALAFPISVSRVRKARRGDAGDPVVAVSTRAHQRLQAKFRTRGAAQFWFERRSLSSASVFVTAVLCVMSLLGWLTANFITDKPWNAVIWDLDHLSLTACFATGAPFLIYFWLPPFFSMVPVGTRTSDGTSSWFLTTRPLVASEYIAVKLRLAAYGAAKIWATLILYGCILLLSPATIHGRSTLLADALLTASAPFGLQTLLLTFSIVLALVFLTWKLHGDLLCWTVTGRRWVQALLLSFAFSVLGVAAAGSHWLYTHLQLLIAHRPEIEAFGESAAIVGDGFKLLVLILTALMLRRRNHISSTALRKSATAWAATALLFILLFCAALAPYHFAWWRVALGVILFMPGVRFALAPLALAWDRSR